MKKVRHRRVPQFVQEHKDNKWQSLRINLDGLGLEDVLLYTILSCPSVSIVVVPVNTNICFTEEEGWVR